jgi:hypothetical protein
MAPWSPESAALAQSSSFGERMQGWLAETPGTESGPEGVQYKPQYTVAEGEGLWGRCGVEEGEMNVEAV